MPFSKLRIRTSRGFSTSALFIWCVSTWALCGIYVVYIIITSYWSSWFYRPGYNNNNNNNSIALVNTCRQAVGARMSL